MGEPVVSEPRREAGPAPHAGSGRRRTRVARAVACVALAALLLAVLLDVSLHRTETIGTVERQPASVAYEDGSTHYAGVVHRRSRVFDRHRSYELYLGRDPGLGYGYRVRLGFGSPETRPVIKTVTWEETGARVAFASGHEVFVPARHYVGGR
ncbi:hypothetical protein ACN3XK_34780 [Actinomadura welshii]